MNNDILKKFYQLKVEEYEAKIKLCEGLTRKALQFADFDLARSYLRDLEFAIEQKLDYERKLKNEF